MKREWGPTFAGGPWQIQRLTEDTREHIREVLSLSQCTPTEAFFDALEQAIAGFKTVEHHFRSAKRPAEIRQDLKRAHASAKKLQDSIHCLDINARLLINEAETGSLTSFVPSLERLIDSLRTAIKKAEQYQGGKYRSSGSVSQVHRRQLAVATAEAIEEHLGLATTTNPTGIFTAVLETIVREATGQEPRDVGRLVRAAVKERSVRN